MFLGDNHPSCITPSPWGFAVSTLAEVKKFCTVFLAETLTVHGRRQDFESGPFSQKSWISR
jgi:hypothetical protein